MTQQQLKNQELDAWVNHELHRIQRQNRIRKTLVFVGLAVFVAGLGATTYLVYNDTPGWNAGEPAPLTGHELRAISG